MMNGVLVFDCVGLDHRQATSERLEAYMIAFVQLARYCVDTPRMSSIVIAYKYYHSSHSNVCQFKSFHIFYLLYLLSLRTTTSAILRLVGSSIHLTM
jgi:hypothetical protein